MTAAGARGGGEPSAAAASGVPLSRSVEEPTSLAVSTYASAPVGDAPGTSTLAASVWLMLIATRVTAPAAKPGAPLLVQCAYARNRPSESET